MEKKKPTRKDKFKNEPNAIPIHGNSRSFSNSIPGFIIFILGFVLYSNTLNHYFTLDDYSVILENRVTKQGISAIPEIFKTSYRYGYYFTSDNLYRPIVKAMYAIEWELTPNKATAGHWMNVLLYALTGFILFQALLKISKGQLLFAFITSILFIAHPVHTEVVASIKSRDEIMSFLFCILALERYIVFVRTQKVVFIISSCFFYSIALLSKESAITFMAVFPVTAWFFTDDKTGKFLKSLIPLALIAGLFFILRGSILGSIGIESVSVADNLLEAAKDPITRLATAVLILGLYLKILFIPHPLVFDYSFNQIPLVGANSISFVISALVYIGLLTFAIVKFKSKNLLAFAILFYLITLSVSSNLFITIGSSMGERFLYAPSLGFCMAISILLIHITKATNFEMKAGLFQNKILAGILFSVLILYSVKTISRNPVWKDNFTLYSNDVLLSPNSTRTHYYLGNYLVKAEALVGKTPPEQTATLQKGIHELKRATEIYPGFSDAFTQLGVAHYKLDDFDSAMFYYQKALKLNPNFATIHNNIGTIYFSKQRFPDALKSFLKAVELDPQYSEAYSNAGSAYGMMKDYDNALSYLFAAIKWDPNNAQAYFFIGLTYRFKGDENNATAYLEKAFVLDPSLRPK